MSPRLTFVIPVGPAHMDVWQQAADAVEAQTVKCDYIVKQDTYGKGAGWARNQGLERVTTPYVAFLDADDVIDPRFAELCLGVLDQYAASHADVRYAYTDWLGLHNVAHKAPEPCEAWTNKTFHLVTTVIPTEKARLIGGFDEQLQGAEDADFYIRLRLSGVCGIHINAPLVSYREGGQRSITARATGQEALALSYMTERYGGYSFMGCCGDSTQGPTGPTNEPSEGDVLAQALWSGNRKERGRVTGRIYPHTSYPKMMYVALADVQAAPMHWRQINSPVQASNGIILQPQYQHTDNWQDLVNAAFGGGQVVETPSQPVEYRPNVAGMKKANVVAKAQEWTKVTEPLE